MPNDSEQIREAGVGGDDGVAAGEAGVRGNEVEVEWQQNGAEEETPVAAEDHGNEQNGADCSECTPREEQQ